MCKKKLFSLLTVGVLLIALTVCGSVWDYRIAKSIYFGQMPKENLFGVIFAFIGIMPTFVGWAFLGSSIFYLSKKQVVHTTKKRWLIALSVLLFLLSFFYFCNTLMMVNNGAFSVSWYIAYPIGIAVIIGAAYGGYKMSQMSKNENLLSSAVFLALVSILTMIIIMSVKGIMDRPRFRWVEEMGNPEYFRNWWQSGSRIKASLNTSVVNDEFASFPSGHSAYAMFAIFLFPAFGEYISKLKKYQTLLFIGGFVWWTLTAFSRMTVGAHYLTDVCIAGLITLLAYAIVYGLQCIIYKSRRN